MKQALIYSIKVWLTTVVLGMRIAVLIKICLDTDHLIYDFEDFFGSAIYDIPIGLIACAPSWILFSLSVLVINKPKRSVMVKKLWLTLAAFILGILPFAIVFWGQLTHPNYWPDMAPEVFGYISVTIASLWFYKLKPADPITDTTSAL